MQLKYLLTKFVSGMTLAGLIVVGFSGLVGCSQPPDLDTNSAAASSGTLPRSKPPTQTTPNKTCTPSNKSGVKFKPTKATNMDPEFERGNPLEGWWWRPMKSWEQMERKERMDHMKRDVHPQMWLMFRRFSPKFDDLKNFHCGTCHGQRDRPENPDFEKPTTLYPLDPNNMPTRNDCNPKTAAMVKFMEDLVTPAMRVMVQNKELDCFSCHAKKGDSSGKSAHP